MKTKLALILAIASSPAFAGTSPVETAEIQVTEQDSSWWLTITPYGWVTATDGDMGVAGSVAPVDISFDDTLQDLELAFMLAAEAGYERWVFGFDGIFGAFSSSAPLPPAAAPLFTNATVDFDQFFARIHAGYQIISEDNAKLTAFVGARYSYLSTDIALTGGGAPTFNVDGSKSWIDPVIGMHGFWEINDRWFLQAGGDIGGFGVNSDLIWQANTAIGYRFSENISALVGYRGLGVDYSDGGFLVDTVAHGPAIGMTFRF
jgi:hypothetical protein